jgi:hypothetical protein
MDGKLKSIHGAWIPAIHAGMTILNCVFMKPDKVELRRLPLMYIPFSCNVVGTNESAPTGIFFKIHLKRNRF